LIDRVFLFVPLQVFLAQMAQTLIEYPPRQKPASFNLDRVMEKINESMGSA
jgi:arylsulfatase